MVWMIRDCSRAARGAPHWQGAKRLQRRGAISPPPKALCESLHGLQQANDAKPGATRSSGLCGARGFAAQMTGAGEAFRIVFAWCACPLIACLLLAGCARLPVVPEAADFRIEGKFGVVEGKRRHAGRFVWRQTGDRYDILLWGPFGQGSTRLRGHSAHVEITGGGASPLSGHPDAVMRQHLGWHLPLAMLPWWLTGQPMPDGGVADAETDSGGRLVAFRQFGWQVRYEKFIVDTHPPQPRRIAAEVGGYRIDLVILNR